MSAVKVMVTILICVLIVLLELTFVALVVAPRATIQFARRRLARRGA
jgi:hypothetical protein